MSTWDFFLNMMLGLYHIQGLPLYSASAAVRPLTILYLASCSLFAIFCALKHPPPRNLSEEGTGDSGKRRRGSVQNASPANTLILVQNAFSQNNSKTLFKGGTIVISIIRAWKKILFRNRELISALARRWLPAAGGDRTWAAKACVSSSRL